MYCLQQFKMKEVVRLNSESNISTWTPSSLWVTEHRGGILNWEFTGSRDRYLIILREIIILVTLLDI